MHNIVEERGWVANREINFYQPRHSPLQSIELCCKVHSTFSLVSKENIKQFFPFLSTASGKIMQTPLVFTFSRLFLRFLCCYCLRDENEYALLICALSSTLFSLHSSPLLSTFRQKETCKKANSISTHPSIDYKPSLVLMSENESFSFFL